MEDITEDVATEETIIGRIENKIRNDSGINKFYCAINEYNKKNKDRKVTCILIVEYIKKDKDGNRINPSRRYKYTLFCTHKPVYEKDSTHVQLMLALITGLEKETDNLMPKIVNITGSSVPGAKFYRKLLDTGLFSFTHCCTGIIGDSYTTEEIPNKFKGLM